MVGAVVVMAPAIPPAAGRARPVHHGQALQQLLQLPGVQAHHELRRAGRDALRRHILPERQQLVERLVLRTSKIGLGSSGQLWCADPMTRTRCHALRQHILPEWQQLVQRLVLRARQP